MDNELELKKTFALELLKSPTEGFKIAAALFPENAGKALEIATRWPRDKDVTAFMTEALDNLGEIHFLPTKGNLARSVWNMSQDARLCVDDKLKAMRLYADIMGFVEKAAPVNINNNMLVQNRTMVVSDHGNDAQWEARLEQQQARLIIDAHAPVQQQ